MSDRRRSELAKIHVAKKQLGLDDETYRAMLREVAGVDSAGKLDHFGRAKVLDHLKRCGFKPTKKGGNARTRPAEERDRFVRKIRAQLANYGRPDGYADAMARHMFGVDRFEWLNPRQLRAIIAALKYDRQRREQGQSEEG